MVMGSSTNLWQAHELVIKRCGIINTLHDLQYVAESEEDTPSLFSMGQGDDKTRTTSLDADHQKDA